MDLRKHRHHEEAAQIDGLVSRLEPRSRDLRPELLPPPAEDVSGFLEGRIGRAQNLESELGPGRHDRARERTGHRRQRLALRRGSRTARADAVVLQDHGLLAGAARRARYARPLAGKSPAHAEKLDRPLGRPALPLHAGEARRRILRSRSLHHAPRHAVRRELSRDLAGSSDCKSDRREESEGRRLHRRMQEDRHRAGSDR